MDPDTLLMPPPPPRLSKRQRVHSPNAGQQRAIATVDPPLSISFPNHQVLRGQSASPGGYKARSGAGEVSDDNGTSPVPATGSSPNDGAAKLAGHYSTRVDFEAKGGHDGKENRPDIDGGCPPRNCEVEGSLRTADGIEDEDDGRRSPDLLVGLAGGANGPPGQVSTAASTDNDNSLQNVVVNGDGMDEDDAGNDGKSGGAPPVSFADIIGHGNAKLRLEEALLPLALPPDLAATVLTGIRDAPASVLLHGPPGESPS